LTDIVDNSGIRITFTPTLRQYDAALLVLGFETTPIQVIPPHEEVYITRTACDVRCMSKVNKTHNLGYTKERE
jgi:hypothetical protein